MTTVITSQSDRVLSFLNPLLLVRHLWKQRDLLRQFTIREVEGRYRGSFLGIFWSFINPLIFLCIYTFVFGVVFTSKWPHQQSDSLGEFAIILFCGITAFNIFSETVNRAASLIISVPNYVKKVVFPLEILPLTTLGAALFHSLISFGILLVAALLIHGAIAWTLPLLPLVMLPMILLSLGLSWFLASLGVFIRDISYTVALVVQVLFFTTPIFYSVDNIPEPFRTVIQLNPLTPVIENVRRVVLWGELPPWRSLIIWIIVTAGVALLGYAWFMKTKKGFADVI